jgi:hypothetical protein
MMQRLLITVVGLHVLMHAVLGCCWHPVPAETEVTAEHATLSRHDRHDHCASHHSAVIRHDGDHRDGDHRDDCGPGDRPHRDHVCCHDGCKWICESTDREFDCSVLVVSVADRPLGMVPQPAPVTAAFLSEWHSEQLAAPPVRLHVALEVFLI